MIELKNVEKKKANQKEKEIFSYLCKTKISLINSGDQCHNVTCWWIDGKARVMPLGVASRALSGGGAVQTI